MKNQFYVSSAVCAAGLACAAQISRAAIPLTEPARVAALSPSKPAKPPAPTTSPSPSPARDSKERKPRAPLPAHLFM